MQGAFLVIFTLLFSGITVFFDGMMGHAVFKQYQSAHWLEVSGTVTDSRVVMHHGSKGSISYSANITYTYPVNGQSFSNDRLRYGTISGNQAAAQATVNAHPPGSAVSVFYNPASPNDSLLFPGVKGGDILALLFLMPFNSFSLAGWVVAYWRARERLVRPVAGGVKIITDNLSTRVRLPRSAASLWGLVTVNIASLAGLVIIVISTRSNPPVSLVLSAFGVALAAGLAVYVWRRAIIQSGIDDLVIDEANRRLELPLTFGRKERLALALADVIELYTEVVEHRSNKGGVSYTYAPTLLVRGQNAGTQKLADWSDKLKADEFTTWLRQKLGITGQS